MKKHKEEKEFVSKDELTIQLFELIDRGNFKKIPKL